MKIFSETGCISKETMYRYLDGDLSAEEMHLVEKHLTDCELCSDELEGLSYMKDRDRTKTIVAELNREIRERAGRKSRGIIFFDTYVKRAVAVAAAVIVVAGSIYILSDISGDQQKQISENVPAKSEEASDKTDKEAYLIPEEGEEEAGINEEKEQKNDLIKEKEIDGVVTKTSGSSVSANTEALQKDKSDNNRQEIIDKIITLEDTDEERIEEDEMAFAGKTAEQKKEAAADGEDMFTLRGAEETGKGDIIGGTTRDDETVNIPASAVEAQLDRKSLEKERTKSEEMVVSGEAESRAAVAENAAREEMPLMELAEVKPVKEKISEKKKSGKKAQAKKTVSYDYYNDAINTEADKTETADAPEIATDEITTVSGALKDPVDNARSRYEAGDYAGVIDLLTDYSSSQPENYNALYYLGLSYYKLGEYDNAITQFNKIITLESSSGYLEDARWYKSQSLLQLNDTLNAREILQEIIQKQEKYRSEAEEVLEDLE